MLKYSISAGLHPEFNKLEISEVYVSPDLHYISGVTPYSNGMVDGEVVQVKSPLSEATYLSPIHLERVRRQGYVVTYENLPIQETKLVGEDVSVSYVEFNNEYYYEYKKDDFDGFLINGMWYDRGDYSYITVKNVHWIENGHVTIKGITYGVDTNLVPDDSYKNGFLPPTIKYNDNYDALTLVDNNAFEIHDYEYDKWYTCYHFNVCVDYEESLLDVDDYAYITRTAYIIYNNKRYDVEERNEVVMVTDEFGDETIQSLSGVGTTIDGVFYNVNDSYKTDENSGETLINYSITNMYELYETCNFSDSFSFYCKGASRTIYWEEKTCDVPSSERIALFINSLNVPIQKNDVLEVRINGNYYKEVYTNEKGELFILYNGKKYLVEDNLYDEITINGSTFPLTYIGDGLCGYTYINNQQVIFNVGQDSEGKYAYFPDKVIVPIKTSNNVYISSYDYQKNGEINQKYRIEEYKGVDVGDKIFKVIIDNRGITFSYNSDGERIVVDDEYEYYDLVDIGEGKSNFFTQYKANAYGEETIYLSVDEVKGSSLFKCTPIFPLAFINEEYKRYVQQITCAIIGRWFDTAKFKLKTDFWGIFDKKTPDMLMVKHITEEDVNLYGDAEFLMNKVNSKPTSSEDILNTTKGLSIMQMIDYISIPVKLSNNVDNSLQSEDLVGSYFVSAETETYLNQIVDMEKDVYYPARVESGITYDISEIRFNFHFRTRDMESWKINEDDSEEIAQIPDIDGETLVPVIQSSYSSESNWFITDYFDYHYGLVNDAYSVLSSSDLVGLLGFTDNDVKYRKRKIAKSFIRISFYSTPDPNTQVLLATSTVFLDENTLFQKQARNSDVDNIVFKEVALYDNTHISPSNNELKNARNYGFGNLMRLWKEDVDSPSSHTISVMSEQIDDNNHPIYDEEHRLSSRITIKNRYETNNSSEGFYMYMFKEYSNGLRESTVYMKVDFCHAGVGQTIPMILPTKLISEDERMPLSMEDESDIYRLKQGIPLKEVYDNMYIPINLKYDESTRKYIYYLPKEYVNNNVDKNIMEFNLFELKLRNEAYDGYDL